MQTDNNMMNKEKLLNEPVLDAFYSQGDPLADDVIKAFADEYASSVDLFTEQLGKIFRIPSGDTFSESLKQELGNDGLACTALEHYFTHAVQCPGWVDKHKHALGEDVFQDYFFSSVVMLACSSLPICYVCHPDVKVLGFTRRFINSAPIRIVDTAQMVTDVMRRGGITIEDNKLGGRGIESILKVRLIHAVIRYLVLHKTRLLTEIETEIETDDVIPNNFLLAHVLRGAQEPTSLDFDNESVEWDIQVDGIPISQESSVLTLLTFSFIMLRCNPGSTQVSKHGNNGQSGYTP